MVCVFIQCYILTVYYLIIISMLVPFEEFGGTVNQPRELGGTDCEVLYNDIECASVVLIEVPRLLDEAVDVYLVVIRPRKSGFLDHGAECHVYVLTAEQANAVGSIVGLAIPFKQREFDKRSPCLESRVGHERQVERHDEHVVRFVTRSKMAQFMSKGEHHLALGEKVGTARHHDDTTVLLAIGEMVRSVIPIGGVGRNVLDAKYGTGFGELCIHLRQALGSDIDTFTLVLHLVVCLLVLTGGGSEEILEGIVLHICLEYLVPRLQVMVKRMLGYLTYEVPL